MAVFLVGFMIYLLSHPVHDFYAWRLLFENIFMRVASVLFFLCFGLHAWIGLHAVITDYFKDTWIKLMGLMMVLFVLAICFIWSIIILWE